MAVGNRNRISVLTLLTTEEIRRALALTERGGVLPNGEVRYPEAFQQAPPAEWEALEHWIKLCGEPLDHLELAEELVDRMGEAHGWCSREAMDAALLLKRLELPNDSSWYVGKMAEAVLSFYAVLDVHPDEPEHPKVLARALASPPYWIWFPGIVLVFSFLPLYFPNGVARSRAAGVP